MQTPADRASIERNRSPDPFANLCGGNRDPQCRQNSKSLRMETQRRKGAETRGKYIKDQFLCASAPLRLRVSILFTHMHPAAQNATWNLSNGPFQSCPLRVSASTGTLGFDTMPRVRSWSVTVQTSVGSGTSFVEGHSGESELRVSVTKRDHSGRGIGDAVAPFDKSCQQTTDARLRQADGLLSALHHDAGGDA